MLFFLLLLHLAVGFTIRIAPHSQQCYSESLEKGDLFKFVINSANADQLTLHDADGQKIYQDRIFDHTKMQFIAMKDGKHSFCIHNLQKRYTIVSFDYSIRKLRRPKEKDSTNFSTMRYNMMKIEDMIEETTRAKKETVYQLSRLNRHAMTVRSTFLRITVFNSIRVFIYFLIAGTQMAIIHRLFSNKKKPTYVLFRKSIHTA